MRLHPRTHLLASSGLILFLLSPGATAQTPDVAEAAATAASADSLRTKATRIADSYGKLEQLILRMAEIESLTNPPRAALLKQAAQQSADRRTRRELEDAIALLAPPQQLKRAIEQEEQALADMKSLLDLLLSEDRADRLKAEEQRIREYIKEVERLIRLQRSAEGQTRGGGDPQRMADEQDRIAGRTGDLADKIRQNEESGQGDDQGATQPADGQGGENAGQEPQPADETNKESSGSGDRPTESGTKEGGPQPPDDKPKESPSNPQESESTEKDSPVENPTPGQGSPSSQQPRPDQPSPPGGESQPGQAPPSGEPQPSGPPGDPPPTDGGNPARKRLQAAEERMREAQRRLEEAQRDQAVEEQEKARHELEKAKAELEQILRQLREEEIGRTLAMLEGRFRRMLEKQLEIYESTKRLDQIEPDKRGRQVDIQASKLGFEETKLAVEADRALLLLFEEGSSVAFPETVEQMRDDMQQVADRLAKSNLGTITQGIEEEIIQALEEMIAALQKAQQELEEQQQQQQQQQQPGDPNEKPLVDAIAELKMIRALQMRVNTRTQRFSRLLADENDPVGQTDDAELRESLLKLGERQERIHEVTRDIVLGKNE